MILIICMISRVISVLLIVNIKAVNIFRYGKIRKTPWQRRDKRTLSRVLRAYGFLISTLMQIQILYISVLAK